MLDSGYASPSPSLTGDVRSGSVVNAPPDDYVPDLTKLRKQYKEWQDAKANERREAREARHYYHGDQWSEDELKTLKKRRQPPITFNRISRKVDGVVGTIMKLRQDPKAFPRTPKHEEGAEIATAAERYALDQARWEEKESETVRDAGIEGIGCIEMVIEEGDQGDKEIGLEVVDGETWFYDPRSFRDDFSDARYMGVAKWMHLDDVKELFPDHSDELDGLITSGGGLSGIDQQDRDKVWMNVEKKHLFTVEHWYIEKGEWHQCYYTSDVKLGHAVSPFIDERGKSQSKYIAFSASVDHDGDRYGFVRNLKSPQDEMNMRRSKALHNLNTRRMLMEMGAIDEKVGIERFRAEMARNDGIGVFAVNALKDGRVQFDDPQKAQEWQGQMEMLAEAKAEIENFGPTLVEKGMEKSGRAIALLQQAGLAELGPFIKAYRGWKLRVYRAVWNAIQRHWSGERWIRVTDSEGAAQFIQLNGLQMDEFGQPQMVNAVGSLDVDIILDEAPDSVNTMADVFELLESLAAAGMPIPPSIVIEMSGLPSSMKKRIMEMLEQAQQPDPMEEQAKQIALEQEQSKTGLNKAGAMDKIASAASKWADIATKPEQMERERENTDREFQARDQDRQTQVQIKQQQAGA